MKKLSYIPLLCLAGQPLMAEERPNVIVFLVDDMGLMDTSLPFLTDKEGNPVRYPLNDWYRTPNMERMARQGIRFSTFYAQSVSSPSRASLMTGQNAARHRVTNWINTGRNNKGTYGPDNWNWEGLNRNTPTLPKMLQKEGYRTIHIGKTHFSRLGAEGDNPKNLGFDINIGDVMVGPRSYLGEENYGYSDTTDIHYPKGLEKYAGTDTFLTEALTVEANKQIDKAVKDKKPFYLYMSHYGVHAPFYTDKRFIGNYRDSSKSDKAKAYATMVEGVDKSLGDIMRHLEDVGIADNTLLFFIGDNGSDAPLGQEKGYTSSAPLRGKKGTEYEGGMRVPFIACWGKDDKENKWQQKLSILPNSVQRQLGTVMDIYPTVLSLLDIQKPACHAIDGYDLAIQLRGKRNEARPERFLMHFPHAHRGSYFTVYRDGDWKLIYYYNPKLPGRPNYELYNLKKDPVEICNLATVETERLVEMVKKMAGQLEAEGALYPIDADGNTLKPVI